MPSVRHAPTLLQTAARATAAPAAHVARSGSWRLDAGSALSLRPRAAAVLAIERGRAWVTLGASGALQGDHVLEAGARLAVAAGAQVVMEAWPAPGAPAEPVCFGWEGAGAGAVAAQCAAAPARRAADWERAVAQPLRELGQSLALGGRAAASAGRAAGRLARGLVRLALGRALPAAAAAAPHAPPVCGERRLA